MCARNHNLAPISGCRSLCWNDFKCRLPGLLGGCIFSLAIGGMLRQHILARTGMVRQTQLDAGIHNGADLRIWIAGAKTTRSSPFQKTPTTTNPRPARTVGDNGADGFASLPWRRKAWGVRALHHVVSETGRPPRATTGKREVFPGMVAVAHPVGRELLRGSLLWRCWSLCEASGTATNGFFRNQWNGSLAVVQNFPVSSNHIVRIANNESQTAKEKHSRCSE
jgi:hypothetical protein